MAKITKTAVDKALRDDIFAILMQNPMYEMFHKINDRQYGCIVKDLNGHHRYIRIGAIVAEEREDMTAEELMQSEMNAYTDKQAEKAEKAAKRAVKAEKDKARREKEKEEKKNA